MRPPPLGKPLPSLDATPARHGAAHALPAPSRRSTTKTIIQKLNNPLSRVCPSYIWICQPHYTHHATTMYFTSFRQEIEKGNAATTTVATPPQTLPINTSSTPVALGSKLDQGSNIYYLVHCTHIEHRMYSSFSVSFIFSPTQPALSTGGAA